MFNRSEAGFNELALDRLLYDSGSIYFLSSLGKSVILLARFCRFASSPGPSPR